MGRKTVKYTPQELREASATFMKSYSKTTRAARRVQLAAKKHVKLQKLRHAKHAGARQAGQDPRESGEADSQNSLGGATMERLLENLPAAAGQREPKPRAKNPFASRRGRDQLAAVEIAVHQQLLDTPIDEIKQRVEELNSK